MEPIHIISLGAGVQSSTLSLMAAKGLIGPMPQAGIFADTKSEPQSVIDWLSYVEKNVPFPIHRVTHKDGLTTAIEASLKSGSISGSPPWFSLSKGVATPLSRACTHDFKIHPIQKKVRELLGFQPRKRIPKGRHAVLWIGISTDEAVRMKDSRYPHIVHRWPLIEIGMSRQDCLRWMEKNGYPQPPKSSCVYCPYHSDSHWRMLRDTDPAGFAEAIRVDGLIREGVRRNGKPPMYAHRSLVPLAEADISSEEERGQLNMFNNECEGMCGV